MTGTPQFPKDIANPQRIEPMMPVGGSDNPRDAGTFQSLLQKQAETTGTQQPLASPFEIARTGAPLATGPTMATLQTQLTHAQTTLGDINNMLSTPKLQVKPSSKYLLRNKLNEASDQLNIVNVKTGGPPIVSEELPAGSGPIQQFLNYVTSSQSALANVQQRMHDLAAKGDQLSPADLLFIQIKMNKAQQLLDYSSILLSKAVDDMKQLFSVQL